MDFARASRWFAWATLTFVAVQYAATIARFVLGPPERFDFLFRAKFIAHLACLRIHALPGVIALASGPLALSRDVREHWPRGHRTVGWLYSLSVVVAAVAGLRLAAMAEGGLMARAGFTLQGLLWLATLALAWVAIGRRDFGRHQRWMARNYALTFAAVGLRCLLYAGQEAGVPFLELYRVAAWASWILTLTLEEGWCLACRIGDL